jgi:hypothetical protein
LYNDGDFSHMYIVMHQYFGLQEKCFKCINKILWIIKHGILYDFFLHMWPMTKVFNFEPCEYKKTSQMIFKKNLLLCIPLVQNFKPLKF